MLHWKFGLSDCRSEPFAERVRMLGRAHTVDSIPGKGTTVRLTIELKGKGLIE
jgi:hypothetical protein